MAKSDPNPLVVDKWNELKVLLEKVEVDLLKNAGGNASAGVRARKGLRLMKTLASDLVKTTIEEGKKE